MKSQRIDLDADNMSQGLGRLVVALLDTVRQVLERQAVRRVDSGALTPDQIERLGLALQELEVRFAELRASFDNVEPGTPRAGDGAQGEPDGDDINRTKTATERPR